MFIVWTPHCGVEVYLILCINIQDKVQVSYKLLYRSWKISKISIFIIHFSFKFIYIEILNVIMSKYTTYYIICWYIYNKIVYVNRRLVFKFFFGSINIMNYNVPINANSCLIDVLNMDDRYYSKLISTSEQTQIMWCKNIDSIVKMLAQLSSDHWPRN